MADDYKIQSDGELKSRVRHATGYTDTSKVSAQAMASMLQDAKFELFVETGSDAWYSDDGITLALYGYYCLTLKASVENIDITGYELGNEQVEKDIKDPEASQQIQRWVSLVRKGLDKSDADTNAKDMTMSNSTGYIGETSVEHDW